MDRIGEVDETANGFEWRIKNFFNLSEDDRYFSPSFNFNSTSWSLGIDPNGDRGNHSVGYIDLRLVKKPGDFPINVEFSLSLKTVNGERVLERHCTENFGEGCDRHISHRIISRSELIRRNSELVPSGVLTVLCALKDLESKQNASTLATAECPYCNDSFEADIISSHEKICLDKPTKCPECSSAILLHNSYDHKCQTTKTEGDSKSGKCFCCEEDLGAEFISLHKKCIDKSIKCPDCSDVVQLKNFLLSHECKNERTEATEKFLNDLKRIMLSGKNSDIIVKVKEEEFKLHKSILGARSVFFDSVFRNDAREMIPDTISINDCEPDLFRILIHFIYTGTVDNLCPENVCALYKLAFTYQEEKFKSECLNFMINTISVDNFCDYAALALKYDEEALFQKATEVFTCKVKEIIDTNNWKAFLEKYTEQGNELYKKALDQYDKNESPSNSA